MSGTVQSCRAVILVKALPQPSKTHGETVCCAGVTAQGQWKRLFPVRFRHLSGSSSFARWDWVKFRFSRPDRDNRVESCRVHEDSIALDGKMPKADHLRVLQPLVRASINEAVERGQSLALIRPKNARFTFKRKSAAEVQAERDAFKLAARQISFFDKELEALEPTPFEFRFKFEDDTKHDFENGDWEAHAMFYHGLQRTKSEKETLEWMNHVFNVDYPERGTVFAVGNQAKRPHVWQLLGVIRLDESPQGALAL